MADEMKPNDDDLADEIAEAISDTLDMDWQPSWAAPNIMAIINRERRLARAEGYAAAREEASARLDGHGGTVIPLLSAFASLVSGNRQPCMSGDARDRLRAHVREDFDRTIEEIAAAIRNMGGDDGAD